MAQMRYCVYAVTICEKYLFLGIKCEKLVYCVVMYFCKNRYLKETYLNACVLRFHFLIYFILSDVSFLQRFYLMPVNSLFLGTLFS